MENKSSKTIPIIIACLIIVGIGYYFYTEYTRHTTPVPQTTDTSTVEIAPGVTATVEDTGKGEIGTSSPLYLNRVIPQPTLDWSVTIPANFPAAAKQSQLKKMNDMIALLKKDMYSYEHWNDLAIYRKEIGEYAVAEKMWVYLTSAAPLVPDAYINLGDLYVYYLHDNPKAFTALTKVHQIAPRLMEGYLRMVDYYVTAKNDTAGAKAFLEGSIKQYPDMHDALTPLLNNLK